MTGPPNNRLKLPARGRSAADARLRARHSLAGALGRRFETAADEGTTWRSATEGRVEMSLSWSGTRIWLVAVSDRLRSPEREWVGFSQGQRARGIPGRGHERGAVSTQPK